MVSHIYRYIDHSSTRKDAEHGSCCCFLKELEPEVVCSDILDLPSNDLTFSALNMPSPTNELNVIFMIGTFHHIPDSKLFLNEVERVLRKGGLFIIIEPANLLRGRFIYKIFFMNLLMWTGTG